MGMQSQCDRRLHRWVRRDQMRLAPPTTRSSGLRHFRRLFESLIRIDLDPTGMANVWAMWRSQVRARIMLAGLEDVLWSVAMAARSSASVAGESVHTLESHRSLDVSRTKWPLSSTP